MSIKIKQIRIEGFRGIPFLELELNSKSLLILGENGTGKSSITEALEFFFTGQIDSLEGTRGLSLQRHGPHVNSLPEHTKIQIKFDPGEISLERTFSELSAIPSSLNNYFDVTQKGVFILRRSQLLHFIISQPADRFYALASIMGVQSLDETELEMMRVKDRMGGNKESIEEDIKNLLSDLSTFLEKEVKEENDIWLAMKEITSLLGISQIESVDQIVKSYEELLKNVKIKNKETDQITKLTEIHSVTDTILYSGDLEVYIEKFLLNIEKVLTTDKEINKKLALKSLLDEGKKILEDQDLDLCPICNQQINRSEIVIDINSRLQTLRDLSDDASNIRRDGEYLKNRIVEINTRLIDLAFKIKSIDDFSNLQKSLDEVKLELDDLLANIEEVRNLKKKIDKDEIIGKLQKAKQVWSSIHELAKKLLDTSELSSQEKKVLEQIALFEKIKTTTEKLPKLKKKYQTALVEYDLSQTLYSTFVDIKKSKIQDIYDSIQGDITNYYSSLHPDEMHGNINLQVDWGRRASAHIKMDSYGRENEDPRALASEGHLDSLGLCIFLGFVKNFNQDCSLIILDDIVTTVDASHRERVCALLYNEFPDKQFVITTHDAIWNDQLIAHQRTYNLRNHFNNMRIVKWNIEDGPFIENHKITKEVIQEKIDNGDKKGAGNLTGQYLEKILIKTAVDFQVTGIIFKFSLRYDIGELYDPTKNRLLKLVNDQEYIKSLNIVLKDLENTSIMRNFLSHYNLDAENISLDEVQNFYNTVNKFKEILECSDCSSDLVYNKQFKIIRCSNPRCRAPFEIKAK